MIPEAVAFAFVAGLDAEDADRWDELDEALRATLADIRYHDGEHAPSLRHQAD